MDANLLAASKTKAERAAILSAEIRRRLGNRAAIKWGEALMKSPVWSVDLYISEAEKLIALLDADEAEKQADRELEQEYARHPGAI